MFVPQGPINNIPALLQIMAWRRPGDKPLSEPMIIILLTHICVTRPQWVNKHIGAWKRRFCRHHFQINFFFTEKLCMRIKVNISLKCVPEGSIDLKSTLVQVITWHWTGDKSLPKLMMSSFTDAYMYVYILGSRRLSGPYKTVQFRRSDASTYQEPVNRWIYRTATFSMW